MIDDFTSSEDQGGSIFESFSDIALCTLAVALLLVTLLAISISQNLSIQVTRNKFSGGVMRPTLNVECTKPNFSRTTSREFALQRALFADQPYVAVHLFGPSLAGIETEVREGGTVALDDDNTFSQQYDLSLYQFMQLAPGIDPGSFMADGQETALLLPSILNKQMVYEPQLKSGYRVKPSQKLTKSMLSALWPVYANPTFATRKSEDYNQARTRILVETKTRESANGEEHYVVIGHTAYRLPDALDDGSLAWLGGFSSGLTEVVFLGETWSDAERNTNKRIDFFEQNGFQECADAYREYTYPSQALPGLDRIVLTLEKLGYPAERIDKKAREVFVQQTASAALLKGYLDHGADVFPPLLAYPDAWAAYVAHYEEAQPDPPKWFYSEFLDRLGFDRLAIERTTP